MDDRPEPGGGQAPLVDVRPGSSGGEFDSPTTVSPPPTRTDLTLPTVAMAPDVDIAPRSPSGGASVTRLVPGISNGRAPPSSAVDEEDP